jgi:hypothetical protein
MDIQEDWPIDFDFEIDSRKLYANKEFESIDNLIDFNDEVWGKINHSKEDWACGGSDVECNTFSKSHDLLIAGDCTNDLSARIEKLRAELELSGLYDLPQGFKSCKRRRVFSDNGDEIDIDRYLADDDDQWQTTKRDGKKEFVTLGINVGMSHGNSADDFAQNSALAYCTAEILEVMGYGVEIKITASGHGSCNGTYLENCYNILAEDGGVIDRYDSETAVTFTCKQFSEPLDLRAIASSAIPALFRRYVFHAFKTIFGGLGNAKETSKRQLDLIGINILIANQWRDGEQINFVEKILQDLQD